MWERLRPFDCVVGDVRDGGAVRRAVRGCDVVFHAAGPVALWGKALQTMRDIHLSGPRQVVQALPAGARLVHTSSVVAVGAASGKGELTEDAPFDLQRLKVDYVHVKREAEAVALAAAAVGRDAVVVNPAYLIGPETTALGDGPALPARLEGQAAAGPRRRDEFRGRARRGAGPSAGGRAGTAGDDYVLGGENLTLAEFAARLAAVRGLPSRRRPVLPAWMQTVAAWYAEFRAASPAASRTRRCSTPG